MSSKPIWTYAPTGGRHFFFQRLGSIPVGEDFIIVTLRVEIPPSALPATQSGKRVMPAEVSVIVERM